MKNLLDVLNNEFKLMLVGPLAPRRRREEEEQEEELMQVIALKLEISFFKLPLPNQPAAATQQQQALQTALRRPLR